METKDYMRRAFPDATEEQLDQFVRDIDFVVKKYCEEQYIRIHGKPYDDNSR